MYNLAGFYLILTPYMDIICINEGTEISNCIKGRMKHE